MAIVQTLCTSFKAEVMLGVHDFRPTGGDTFKIALYTADADLGASTTAYTATNEISGTNYTAGGASLTNLGVDSANGTGYATFSNVTWGTATITARGALIYNSTPSANSNANVSLTNAAVAVLDFGADKTVTADDFTVGFPAGTSSAAVIRFG